MVLTRGPWVEIQFARDNLRVNYGVSMLNTKSSLITALCAVIVLFAAGDAFAAKKYKIKSDAVTGSRLKKVEVESLIPFDKHYKELTQAQKNLFRAN